MDNTISQIPLHLRSEGYLCSEAPADGIIDLIAEHHGITRDAMLSRTRKREILFPRQIAMTLIKTHTKLSFAKIGAICGNFDHSTVIHARKAVADMFDTDNTFRNEYESLSKLAMRIAGREDYIRQMRVCNHCGSDDLMGLYWTNINTLQVDEHKKCDMLPVTCMNCKREVNPVSREEFINLKKKEYNVE